MKSLLMLGTMIAVVAGCGEVPDPRGADAAPPEVDAAPPDAIIPPGVDATPPDAVIPPEVVVEDDFDDGDVAGWTVVNATWSAADGALTAGRSCQNRVYCSEGPAAIRSRAWPVGDGTYTVEYDFKLASDAAGYSGSEAALHNDVPVAWKGDWIGLDRNLLAVQNAFATDKFYVYRRADRPDAREVLNVAVTLQLDAWHHARLRYCGTAGFHAQITRRSDEAVVLDAGDPSADMRPAPDIVRLVVFLAATGADHAFDNLRVTRGCGPIAEPHRAPRR